MDDIREKIDERFSLIEEKLKNSFKLIKDNIEKIDKKISADSGGNEIILKEELEKLKKETRDLNESNKKNLDKKVQEIEKNYHNYLKEIEKLTEEKEKLTEEKETLGETVKKIEDSKKNLKLKKKLIKWFLKYKTLKYNNKLFSGKQENFEKNIIAKTNEIASIYKDIIVKNEEISRKRQEIFEKKQQEFEENIIAETNKITKIYERITKNNENVFKIIRENDARYFKNLKNDVEEINEKYRLDIENLNKESLKIADKENNFKIKKLNFTNYKNQLSPKESFIKERKFFLALLFSGIIVLLIFGFFKSPLDFPGLTKRIFLAFVLVSLVILFYYLELYKKIKQKNLLKKLKNIMAKISLSLIEKEKIETVKIEIPKKKTEPMKQTNTTTFKKSWFDKLINKLADD